VIIGANRKINPSIIKNPKEKFSMPVMKRNLFPKYSVNGTIKRKSRVDKDASTKLKLRTVKAEEVSVNNRLM